MNKNLTKILIGITSVLILLGMVLVFSASGTYSALKFDSIYRLFNSHIVRVFIAAAALVGFAIIPYESYKVHSKKSIAAIVIVLFITFLVASKFKGANRWLNFYIFTIQPSEIAKIVLMMHMAYLIEKKGELIKDFKQGFVFPLFWISIVAGLVIVQPNVSTSIIIVLISFAMLYVGGAKFKHIVFTLGSLGAVGGTIMMLFSHSRGRVLSFIHSLTTGADINIQVKQAKIGLGSGGLFGVGLGQSRQSDLFLPESYGDFIFSILGEELGFAGAMFVLVCYFAIFWIGLQIAKNASDEFGQLLAFGLSFNIVISAFINASVVTGLFPTTGITLPFISYGGTSITFMCASIGIIINIARRSYSKTDINIVG